MNKNFPAELRPPTSDFNALESEDDESSPWLLDSQALQDALLPSPVHLRNRFWGNAKTPTRGELTWIESFGKYPKFDPTAGKLSKRVELEIADLRQATQIIVYYHYLHRGRTMAQLPYWVKLDSIRVGVLLFSLPRLSVPLDGIPPMNVLELARMWLSPDVQGRTVFDSQGIEHSVSVASCAVGKALERVRQDWDAKYPHMPDIRAIVSWADTVHHEGTIYKASNFAAMGSSGGGLHGSRRRPNGGRDQLNSDYANNKTRFLYLLRKDVPKSSSTATRTTEQLSLMAQ